jgi:hypothetical protein
MKLIISKKEENLRAKKCILTSEADLLVKLQYFAFNFKKHMRAEGREIQRVLITSIY